MTLRRSVVAAVLLVAASAPLASLVRADDLKPGTTLDSSTAAAAKDLLPPEILAHYEKNDYVNPIVDWPESKFNWPEDFQAASKKNEGKYVLAKDGSILDKESQKQPPYIFGFPFPNVDTQDPEAGAKAIWNFFYRTWYFGNLLAESQVNMINPGALERRLDVVVYFKYFDGVPEAERPENKGNFLVKFLNLVVSPADVNGTANITWRYRDPGKRDSSWAYVPALRRVRQVSPANRSDGFLGSDMSQDDGPFFDGKPEDFTWTLTGEADQLRIVDPMNLEGKSNSIWIPGGGWRANWDPELKIIGFQDPEWKGLAWAPRSAALAKRHFYVLEGVPKDKYYLYGKIQLYVDKETFQGAWNRKFSWTGELLNTLQTMGYNLKQMTRPDGTIDYIQGSNMSYNVAENIKANRATVAGLKSDPKAALDTHHPYDPAFFDMNSLSRFGK